MYHHSVVPIIFGLRLLSEGIWCYIPKQKTDHYNDGCGRVWSGQTKENTHDETTQSCGSKQVPNGQDIFKTVYINQNDIMKKLG